MAKPGNRTALFLFAVAAGLAGVVPAGNGQTIERSARAQFARFRKAVAAGRVGSLRVERMGTFVRAASKDWRYVIDVAGNQTVRPAQNARRVAEALRAPLDDIGLDTAERRRLVAETQRWAKRLCKTEAWEEANLTVKREIILVRGPDQEHPQQFGGRVLVRLNRPTGKDYFQILFGPGGRPTRVDTNVRTAQVDELVGLLLKVKMEKARGHASQPISVGTFFDPDEHRFEISAYSYEGEPFLQLTQRSNPFGRDHFDVQHKHLVNVEAYRKSEDYHYWCWRWWHQCGEANGVRGNWDAERERWDYPNVTIQHHRDLKQYALVNGEPTATNKLQQSDGKTYRYPFAVFEQIDPHFYDELDECHVAFLLTHGGQWEGRYRFRRGLDVWVEFKPPAGHKLGRGNLRHLFLEDCAGMTCFRPGEKPHLFNTWMAPGWADGVRTVSGADGEYVAVDRNGWRFFGHYHKGDSISDAWTLALIDECLRNDPASVAFGGSRTEALATLLDGRITDERASAKWMAGSVWTSVPVLDH